MSTNLTPDQVGYMKFAIGGTLAVVVGVAVYIVNGLRPVLDDELCIVDQAPLGHTVVVADISEIEDAQTLPDVIRDAAKSLPQYHRLSVYRIADLTETASEVENTRNLWPLVNVFSACNPGRGDEVNPFVVGSRYAEQRYQQMFAAPLDVVIKETASRAGSRTSPILSALARLKGIQHFGADIPERHLLIRSDLLEHNPPHYSHYADEIESLDYALARAGVGIPNLGHLNLEVEFVERAKARNRQTSAHRAFWMQYFNRANAPDALGPATLAVAGSSPQPPDSNQAHQ